MPAAAPSHRALPEGAGWRRKFRSGVEQPRPRCAPPRAAGWPRPSGCPARLWPGTAALWLGVLRLGVGGKMCSELENYSACMLKQGPLVWYVFILLSTMRASICTGTAVMRQLRKAQRAPGEARSARGRKSKSSARWKPDWLLCSSVSSTGVRFLAHSGLENRASNNILFILYVNCDNQQNIGEYISWKWPKHRFAVLREIKVTGTSTFATAQGLSRLKNTEFQNATLFQVPEGLACFRMRKFLSQNRDSKNQQQGKSVKADHSFPSGVMDYCGF